MEREHRANSEQCNGKGSFPFMPKKDEDSNYVVPYFLLVIGETRGSSSGEDRKSQKCG